MVAAHPWTGSTIHGQGGSIHGTTIHGPMDGIDKYANQKIPLRINNY